jgi:hypothetical protein
MVPKLLKLRADGEGEQEELVSELARKRPLLLYETNRENSGKVIISSKIATPSGFCHSPSLPFSEGSPASLEAPLGIRVQV